MTDIAGMCVWVRTCHGIVAIEPVGAGRTGFVILMVHHNVTGVMLGTA